MLDGELRLNSRSQEKQQQRGLRLSGPGGSAQPTTRGHAGRSRQSAGQGETEPGVRPFLRVPGGGGVGFGVPQLGPFCLIQNQWTDPKGPNLLGVIFGREPM